MTDRSPFGRSAHIVRLIASEIEGISTTDDDHAHAVELSAAIVACARQLEEDAATEGSATIAELAARMRSFGLAVLEGHSHFLLDRWQNLRKTYANRPPPTLYTQRFRARVAEVSVALQGAGLNAGRARKLAAEMGEKNSSYGGIQAETVRKWEAQARDFRPRLMNEALNFGRRHTQDEVKALGRRLIEQAHLPVSKWTVADPWLDAARLALAPTAINQPAHFALASPSSKRGR